MWTFRKKFATTLCAAELLSAALCAAQHGLYTLNLLPTPYMHGNSKKKSVFKTQLLHATYMPIKDWAVCTSTLKEMLKG